MPRLAHVSYRGKREAAAEFHTSKGRAIIKADHEPIAPHVV
jgi:hypothetical protein